MKNLYVNSLKELKRIGAIKKGSSKKIQSTCLNYYLFMNPTTGRSHTAHIFYSSAGQYTPKRTAGQNTVGPRMGKWENSKNHDGTWSRPRLRKHRHVSHRNSAHFEDSIILKKKPYNHLEQKLSQMKSELQKLPYRKKLAEIENLIKRSKQLQTQFGYFCVIATMLQYHPLDRVKLSLWVHPDARASKPLHPIKKKTEFECQLEFMNCLKSTLKQLFPTIDLSSGKTYHKLLQHIISLKENLTNRTKKSFVPFNMARTMGIRISKSNKNFQSNKLITSLKSVPKFQDDISERVGVSKQKFQPEKFETKRYHKDTLSTLMESFKSNISFLDKAKLAGNFPGNQREGEIKEQRQRSEISGQQSLLKQVRSQTVVHRYSDMNEIANEHSTSALKSIIFNQNKATNNAQEVQPKHSRLASLIFPQGISEADKRRIKHSILKNSKLGKYMTASIEIQSQLNNLFGSDDFPKGFYDVYGEGVIARNSVLSKVAEEFEDLLF